MYIDALNGKTVTRETLLRYTPKSHSVNDLIRGSLWKFQTSGGRLPGYRIGAILTGGGQPAHEFLLLLEQSAHLRCGWTRLNASLDFGEFPFGLPVLERFDTAQSLFPGRLVGFFEEDFEEQPPVALFQHRGHFRRLQGLACEAGDHQRRENLLRFQAVVETRILQTLRQFVPESFGLRQHSNQPALHGLCRASDQFRLRLQFAAAFRGRFAQSCAQHWLVQPKLLRDARCPFRDRKSTRLNSSHGYISYAVFCLKKKRKSRSLQVEKKIKEINGKKAD